jgi:molybdenum cofactor cytidylyltransferase
MNAVPNYCGVILAAGASTRMGRNKSLLPWPPGNTEGTTFLSSAISSIKTVTESVVVVFGKNWNELEPIATSLSAHVAVNPDPDRGHFSSMQVGLQKLATLGCDTAIITPVDRPPIGERNMEALRRAYEQCSDGVWAMIPTHNGENGHPLIAGARLIDALLRAPVESNAHQVMSSCCHHLRYLDLNDPAVTLNVNTPCEYQQAAALLKGK